MKHCWIHFGGEPDPIYFGPDPLCKAALSYPSPAPATPWSQISQKLVTLGSISLPLLGSYLSLASHNLDHHFHLVRPTTFLSCSVDSRDDAAEHGNRGSTLFHFLAFFFSLLLMESFASWLQAAMAEGVLVSSSDNGVEATMNLAARHCLCSLSPRGFPPWH